MLVKQRRLPRRELPDIRRQFIRMFEDGVSAEAIKSALRLSRATYFEWKRLYLAGGVEALAVRPIPGAKSKLTDEQTAQLRSWLVGRDPRQFQFDFALWTRVIVGQLIVDRFGVRMTPQGIGKLLRRLGLSPQRPLYRASQQDPEAVRRWREEEFPAIRAQSRSGPRSTSATRPGCAPITTRARPGHRSARPRSWRPLPNAPGST